jgi:hypothetical protein
VTVVTMRHLGSRYRFQVACDLVAPKFRSRGVVVLSCVMDVRATREALTFAAGRTPVFVMPNVRGERTAMAWPRDAQNEYGRIAGPCRCGSARPRG